MKGLRWSALAFGVVTAIALGLLALFLSDEARLSVLDRDLATAQAQRTSVAADLQVVRDQKTASQVQANALATRVAALEAQTATAPAAETTWNSQTVTFKSDFDGSSQSYVLVTPKANSSGKRPLVVYFHSLGHGPDELATIKAGSDTLISFLIARGVIIASPTYRGDSWLNPAATSDVTQMIRTIQSRYQVGTVILSGFSMGGTSALIYPLLAPQDIPIGGLVVSSFLSDVAGVWTEGKNTQVKESLRAAYGGMPDEKGAIYEERSVVPNLIRLKATMPIALYVSYTDSMMPVVQQTRLRDALAVRGNPLMYVVVPGDHHLDSLDEGFAFVLNRLAAQ